MAELVFPIAAVAVTFLLIIPAFTLLSRAALAARRKRVASWAEFGADATFAWLVAPTLLPLLWLTSSALHQSEPAQRLDACLVDHVLSTTCLDAVALLGLLLVGMASAVALHAWRERPRFTLDRLPDDHRLARRVAALTGAHPALKSLDVSVARRAPAPIFTVGWLRPRIILDACFAHDADDAMLRAALLHERAHAASFDTLRGSLVRLCLAVNPAGRWLAADLARWHHAREALCDSEAVHLGGEPLALAQGIVRAARFRCAGLGACAALLCGHDRAALKLRLNLLLNGGALPLPTRTIGHAALAVAVAAVLLAPHLQAAGPLEHFHFEVERLLHTLP